MAQPFTFLKLVSRGFPIAMLLGVTPLFADPPEDSILFHCSASAAAGFDEVVTCKRSDTRTSFQQVPSGMYLYATDIIVNPNSIATSGIFTALIGRSDPDQRPGVPNIDLIGSPTQQLSFSTPYLVLKAGEALAIRNFSSSDFPIDVRISGFMADQYSAPLPPLIFEDSFED